MNDTLPIIYMTGFGPFSYYSKNSSEEAVKILSNWHLEDEIGARIETDILKVEYDFVNKLIPRRLKELNPTLVVHVGVSGTASTLTFEKLAYNYGYNTCDNCGNTPECEKCIEDSEEDVIHTGLQVDAIVKAFRKIPNLRISCCMSTDPGRYLCSYVYYKSLHIDRSRVIFIHVPPISKSCASEDIAYALKEAVKVVFKYITSSNDARKL